MGWELYKYDREIRHNIAIDAKRKFNTSWERPIINRTENQRDNRGSEQAGTMGHRQPSFSNRGISLGSSVEIGGRLYKVADHTALWVGNKHGFTIDLFSSGMPEEAKKWGVRYEEVKILK